MNKILHRGINISLIFALLVVTMLGLGIKPSMEEYVLYLMSVIYLSFPFDGTERHRTVTTLYFLAMTSTIVLLQQLG